jgi:hypothetical protein
MTHAPHNEREYARKYGRGQFEGKTSLAADGDSQHSAAVAVGLTAVVLNPGVKCRRARGVDTECQPSAFVPVEHRFVNLDADEPFPVARAAAVRRRRMETPGSGEAGEELASTVLPFTDLHDVLAVAVDAAGDNLYVSDGRVLKLSGV